MMTLLRLAARLLDALLDALAPPPRYGDWVSASDDPRPPRLRIGGRL